MGMLDGVKGVTNLATGSTEDVLERQNEQNKRGKYRTLDELGVQDREQYLGNGNYDKWGESAAEGAAGVQERKSEQMDYARINGINQGNMRSQQDALIRALQDQAAGRGGPSVAEQQMQAGLASAQKQALGTMSANAGLSPAAAARLSGQQQEQMATNTNQQMGVLRSQEQMQAQQALAGVLQGARGQDLQLAQSQAQMQQGANQANLQAAMQQQAQIDSMTQYYTDLGYDADQARAAAANQYDQMLLQKYGIEQGVAVQQQQLAAQRRAQNMQIVGGVVGAAATLGAAGMAPKP